MALTKKGLLFSFCTLFALMEIYFFNFETRYFFYYSPWLLFLFFVALSFKRGKLFFKDWLVFLSQILFFNFLRGAISLFNTYYSLPIYSKYIIELEHLFTPDTSLAHMLQIKLTSPFSVSWLEAIMAFIYVSHFFVFFIIAFVIWLHRAPQFWRFHWAFISCAYIALVCYLLVPTVPPWMASEQHLIPPVRNILQSILSIKFDGLVKIFDTNPVAAMPSLHVAFPSICFFTLTYHFGLKRSWPFSLYLMAIIFSTLLLGAHYVGDLIAGFLLALFCFYICFYKLNAREYSTKVSNLDFVFLFVAPLIYLFLQQILKFIFTEMYLGV